MVFILAFQFTFFLETFILGIVFQITEKKQRNKSKQLFDVIIDSLKGLGYTVGLFLSLRSEKKLKQKSNLN